MAKLHSKIGATRFDYPAAFSGLVGPAPRSSIKRPTSAASTLQSFLLPFLPLSSGALALHEPCDHLPFCSRCASSHRACAIFGAARPTDLPAPFDLSTTRRSQAILVASEAHGIAYDVIIQSRPGIPIYVILSTPSL